MKVQEIQRGQEAPHNDSAILPKDIQMTPLCPKGLINPIVDTRLSSGPEGVDGFPGDHPNLNSGHPRLLDNISRWVVIVKMHPTTFRPKEVKNESFKNVQQLSNVGKATSVVTLNIGKVILSFKN